MDLVVDPDADRAELDLDRLDRLFRDGARTLLLTQPHNPWGRVFTRAELEGVRDVVLRHGARVVSDEMHAPLVLPGAEHMSYLEIEGTHDHAVALVAASKAFNIAGLRCAQMLSPDGRDGERLFRPRRPATTRGRRSAWPRRSRLRLRRRVAGALVARLDGQRTLLGELLAEHLPDGADAAAGGDVPRLARPPRATATTSRRGSPSSTGGCSLARVRSSSRACPDTSG